MPETISRKCAAVYACNVCRKWAAVFHWLISDFGQAEVIE